MSIKFDMLQLPIQMRRNLARFARKLLSEEPMIDTIIINRKRDTLKAEKPSDFELFIFFNGGKNIELKGSFSESAPYDGSDGILENYRIHCPGKGYVRTAPSPSEDEAKALLYKSAHAYRENFTTYQNFLREHLKFFTKESYLNITTVNSMEMERNNPLFYKLYMSHCFEKGYVIYNRLLKPFITTHNLEDLKEPPLDL